MGKGREIIDLIHNARHLCTFSRIDGHFRGQTSDKICQYEWLWLRLFIVSKRDDNFIVIQNIHIELARFTSLLFAMRTLIYGRYCIQKSDHDHFHPYFDIIVFKMKRSLFPVVLNKQTQPQFLLLAIFFSLVSPLRNHVTLLLSHQSLSAFKDGGYRE